MNPRLVTPASLALGALVALGCGFGSSTPGTTNDADPAGGQPAGEQKKSDTRPAAFAKQTKTIGDKLTVSTNTPALWAPPQLSAGHKAGNKAFRVSITFTNGGSEPVDGALMQYQAVMGAEGTACEAIYADGLTVNPGMIQPGRKLTVKVGFSCATKDTSTVGVQVTSGFDSEVADFEGKPSA